MLRFDKVTYLSLLFKFTLSERLSNSLWGLDVLLIPELINRVSTLLYYFTELIIFLDTFLVISFALYKEYMIWWISFSKFTNVLRDFTGERDVGNLWSICLEVFHFWKH